MEPISGEDEATISPRLRTLKTLGRQEPDTLDSRFRPRGPPAQAPGSKCLQESWAAVPKRWMITFTIDTRSCTFKAGRFSVGAFTQGMSKALAPEDKFFTHEDPLDFNLECTKRPQLKEIPIVVLKLKLDPEVSSARSATTAPGCATAAPGCTTTALGCVPIAFGCVPTASGCVPAAPVAAASGAAAAPLSAPSGAAAASGATAPAAAASGAAAPAAAAPANMPWQ
ncbi:hypothetical protein ACLKA7_000015 [Drosophila subpalustris]